MNKTHLYEKHKSLNARIVDFAGWQMPVQYNNLREEVNAVRNNIGVFDVSHMGEFFVSGPQALDFVDYMVTNDIKNAEMKKAIYSPLCREDGTVIDDLIVYKIKEDFLMICVNASNIEKDYSWFQLHNKDFDVELANKSSNYSLLAVQGPNSLETLKKIKLTSNIEDIPYYSLMVSGDENLPTIYARTGYTGEDGFEIFAPHEFISELWDELLNLGVTPCGLGARDVLRLEVCYPLYGHELNDQITPLDAALKWTVKLNKKSFIGKEALAKYAPKFQLVKLMTEKGIPREGYKLFNDEGKEVGEVTSGTMSVSLNKGIALGRLNKNYVINDTILFIEIRNKKYPAIISKNAFVSGGHK